MQTMNFYNDSTLDVDSLRKTAIALVNYACNGTQGVNYPSSIYNEVTENRQTQNLAGYSSCSDLCTWMLKNLGCVDSTIVNRDDVAGWKMGESIIMLINGSTKAGAFVTWHSGLYANPGDILYMGNDNASTHVCVVASHDENSFDSFNYGQFFNGAPGGIRKTIPVKNMLGGQYVGLPGHERRIHGWIDISKLTYTVDATLPDEVYNSLC